ncbi:TetR/AcrR family transcriptional regulator [Alphaproteobacteria bacterium]|nr:TetR/AcrR family transcriptional regulator [Alphaproteobacteria bacterium]
MVNLGRPVSLNRRNVSEVCMNIYWRQGIKNISYNDVIKTSKLSKGSFYRLFNNEDDLQAETLKTYHNQVNSLRDKLEEVEDFFQMMSILKNWKFNNNLKYCYFFVSYLERYRMGRKTMNSLNNIEVKYRQLLHKIYKKHVEKYNIKKSDLNIDQVVNFIFNSIAIISLLHRNKSNKSNISLYKDSLYQFIINLGLTKSNI